MLYKFTNRRRAKDTVMLICDRYPDDIDKVMAFVQQGMVYVGFDGVDWNDVDTIMHYGELSNKSIDVIFDLTTVIEAYRGEGLRHFRV